MVPSDIHHESRDVTNQAARISVRGGSTSISDVREPGANISGSSGKEEEEEEEEEEGGGGGEEIKKGKGKRRKRKFSSFGYAARPLILHR